MDAEEYLEKILDGQSLPDQSDEMKALREERKAVEGALRDAFPDSSPTVRYGGSIAKGTLVRECYDLDIINYFPHDEVAAGATLKDLYLNTEAALQGGYLVERKSSALRLKSKGAETFGRDFHIDVVPGRYIDETRTDCFLYQSSGEKERLKTNLAVHIEHVKSSGVVAAIRLMKLWKARRALRIKQFAFELLIIQELKAEKKKALADQLEHFWNVIRDNASPIAVEDPANPSGNDLAPVLAGDIWTELRSAAELALNQVANSGWETVYGPVSSEEDGKLEKLRKAASAVVLPSKPWLKG